MSEAYAGLPVVLPQAEAKGVRVVDEVARAGLTSLTTRGGGNLLVHSPVDCPWRGVIAVPG